MLDKSSSDNLLDPLNKFNIPIGIYVVRHHPHNQEDYIADCNESFARLFRFNSVAEARGTPIVNLYRTRGEYEHFKSQFLQHFGRRNEEEDYLPARYSEVLKALDGKDLSLQIYCRPDYDEFSKLIGRTGAIIDTTTEVEFLFEDVGNVLHHFTSVMLSIDKKLRSFREILRPDPFGDNFASRPSTDAMEELMQDSAKKLTRGLKRLLEFKMETNYASGAFSNEQWDALETYLSVVQNYKEHIIYPQHRAPTLGTIASKIINILHQRKPDTLNREITKNLIDQASELERLNCAYQLHLATGRIAEMEYELKSLRERAINHFQSTEPKTVESIYSLIDDACRDLSDFAISRNVELRVDGRLATLIRVDRHEMLRAIENLLHNAIKYSWEKREEKVWIAIRNYVEDNMTIIEIENYGVPIPPDEINSGLIFRLGFRGRMSGDRSRRGTGVGLHDTQQVLHNHHCDLKITSDPARGDNYDDLSQPFITIARVAIPIWKSGKTRNARK